MTVAMGLAKAPTPQRSEIGGGLDAQSSTLPEDSQVRLRRGFAVFQDGSGPHAAHVARAHRCCWTK